MSDLTLDIARLIQGKDTDLQTFRVVNKLRDQELLSYRTSASVTTAHTGVFTTLWSATIPRNSSWVFEATIIGRGGSEGASYRALGAVQDFAGTASVVGGSFPAVTVIGEDAAAMDSKWLLTAGLLSLQVKDDGLQSMNWEALIEGVRTT